MSETFWETETAVEAPPEAEMQPEIQAESGENIANEEAPAAEAEARALTVSMDDFASLEERILRTVALVKQERQARTAAEAQAAIADAQLAEAAAQAAQAAAQAAEAEALAAHAEAALREEMMRNEQMKSELTALRTEREQVKSRVNKLLEQLDALEL
jgi:chromosome segregation ATPase